MRAEGGGQLLLQNFQQKVTDGHIRSFALFHYFGGSEVTVPETDM